MRDRGGDSVAGPVRAERLAFLVDAAAYFDAVADAMARATRSITIVGWDVHSRVRLRRGERSEASELGPMLDRLVRRRPGLRVRILAWDFSVVYAPQREFLPAARWAIETGGRVDFRLDGTHPIGASHHEKLVVVDDRLAFVGGIDLTARRWDTSAHDSGDERRTDPDGTAYDPFHDVQTVLDGDAAAALAAHAHDRWRRATGERTDPAPGDDDPWPAGVEADLRDVDVRIERTRPELDDEPGCREIEQRYLELIESASETIYIENQFFSSHAIGRALERRVARSGAPEIVIVLPRRPESWLEDVTIGHMQSRRLLSLLDADHHDRVRVYRPTLDDPSSERAIVVHSKLCIVDGRRLTLGSANLTNRSMALDTECNISIDAPDGSAAATAIRSLRHRLIGEHLGCGADRLAAAIDSNGSLIGAIEALRGDGRTLDPFRPKFTELPELIDDALTIVDPERPLSFDGFVSRFLSDASE